MTGPDALAASLFDPSTLVDPYPTYHRLRAADPMLRVETDRVRWYATSHRACSATLLDATMRSTVAFARGEGADAVRTLEARAAFQRESLRFLDPPHHTKLRRLVARSFTPARMRTLQDEIAVGLEAVVDDVEAMGRFEVLDDLAFPFVVRVIGTLVGVPAADWDHLRALVLRAALALEPNATIADVAASNDANGAFHRYFAELVEERRRRPTANLSGDLAAAVTEGGISDAEAVSLLVAIFGGGFETTTNLIGNAVVSLLRHREAWRELCADPAASLPLAVEEVLRFDPPVQFDTRTCSAPTEVLGRMIEPGDEVLLVLGAANRDPEVFEAPDELRLVPRAERPLTFALGIHHCLGANLARLEATLVLGALAERFPGLELVAVPVQRPRFALRGYEAVQVAIAGC